MLASASSSNPVSQPAGGEEHHERAAIRAGAEEGDELQSRRDRADSDRGKREDQRVDGCLPAHATACYCARANSPASAIVLLLADRDTSSRVLSANRFGQTQPARLLDVV